MNQQESTPDIQSATTCSDRQVGMKSKREDEDAECEEGAHVSGQFEFTFTLFPFR